MDIHDIHNISTNCTRTEFVGTAVLDTIGLVISGVDSLLKEMNVGTQYHCLGLFSSRTGAAGQITAIDDAVKATNTEVLSIELPRDTKGWGGHGNYIVLGGNDVSDVRHAISLALQVRSTSANPATWSLLFPQVQVLLSIKPSAHLWVKHLVSWQVLRLLSVL